MKIPPELETYIVSNTYPKDFRTLLDAIRKGLWSYDETSLEVEYKALCWLSKLEKSLGWKFVVLAKWVFFVFGIFCVLNNGDPFGALLAFSMGSIPDIRVFLAIKKAKKFLAHTYKLAAGGIRNR